MPRRLERRTNLAVGGAEQLSNQALSDAASRLLDERGDLAPGSVLRCFARSVRAVLRAGCEASQVAVAAEQLTRELLEQRPTGLGPPRGIGPHAHLLQVPRPRRAS
ncbi:hypothetical protein ASC64_06940 [Nocardioides sp. Root122]|uniref:hypothetical protein n=1 Tax=Nocardioides TaxID=1839 RepID=UPI000702B5F5|nr:MULTISPECIES: hypothetical protein [Nocardioides]KQV69576.1 hypothetical protein ASC64_06940 [Nocardioides sp. Root122]MCK9824498.1 hypothetical protein [Nocardioides cavernae]